MLNNRYAFLFVRSERPMQDEKYDLKTHPRIRPTTDGGRAPYRHGTVRQDAATV